MSKGSVRDPSQGDVAFEVLGVCAGIAVAGVVGASVAMQFGTEQDVPVNPMAMVAGLIKGDLVWESGASVVAIAFALALIVLVAVGMWLLILRKRDSTRVDELAKYMGRGRDIASLTEQACRAKAESLQVRLRPDDVVGIQLGYLLLPSKPVFGSAPMLRGSWEDLHVDIWGPRTGKSTSRVIPAVLDAPGAVLTTSNKRDVVDATRDVREAMGSQVWVFDPQRVANEEPSWWWNPLTWVTDEVRAADLADHFASGDDGLEAKTDAFFDPEGKDLLAALFLAAALDRRPITQAYTWVTDVQNQEAVKILRQHGYGLQADGLAGQYNAPDKQRGGVFGTAKKMIRSLKIRTIHPWVTSDGLSDPRPHFDPREFVRSGGTLYSLSREGNGSAGPLVTALTVAVIDAAEELATTSPKGRLPVPLVAPLDEVANVVRWSKLPSLYSHYGSRGIIIMAILQSWSQGVEVWGERGMKKLWSAANVKVYGGGVAVDDGVFLRDMSTAIGDHWEITGSVTASSQGRSTSKQRTKVRTFTESELEALPRGRAIVRSSGNRPVIVRTAPWMAGPHADQIRASIEAHDPAAPATLAEAEEGLSEWLKPDHAGAACEAVSL
ncbi:MULTISPECIES: type IV secretory system conjugative DNA transfer family protein [Rhodococcus]|uniref:type IV secretory system conjugative DNA transfer family protein n=3 Tax=Nocardiaceae TaxID=85025 RepID=UPI0008062100|nr:MULTISPECIES: type IV secretory system conjugative DNA transfer family protein [Rhodococcus]ANQ76166.1 conjugal transfer protein [Rhodococcus sp. 008]MBW4818161.1 TraM recognition domain-containing protein [Rhodococcus qingshengii]